MTGAIDSLLVAVAITVLAFGGWWTLLATVALPRPRPPAAPTGRWRFVVLVPAHNEEASIARTIESLSAAQWSPRPEIVVIADNCDDATAEVARSHGTTVLERIDPQRKGKGYALEWAIERLAERPRPPDVVAFVDADTVVQAEFFRAIASRLERGAEAVQLHYEAAPGVTDLARLRRLAFMLVHWARPLGLARLGLGSGLKGNGMAIRWDLARGGAWAARGSPKTPR